MADTAYRIVTSTNHSTAFLDVELLRCMGVNNFDPYLLYPDKQDIDVSAAKPLRRRSAAPPHRRAAAPLHSRTASCRRSTTGAGRASRVSPRGLLGRRAPLGMWLRPACCAVPRRS